MRGKTIVLADLLLVACDSPDDIVRDCTALSDQRVK